MLKDPSGFVLYFLLARVKSILQLNLKSFRNICVGYLHVSWGSKEIIDAISDKLIFELRYLVLIHGFIYSCRFLPLFNHVLLFHLLFPSWLLFNFLLIWIYFFFTYLRKLILFSILWVDDIIIFIIKLILWTVARLLFFILLLHLTLLPFFLLVQLLLNLFLVCDKIIIVWVLFLIILVLIFVGQWNTAFLLFLLLLLFFSIFLWHFQKINYKIFAPIL